MPIVATVLVAVLVAGLAGVLVAVFVAVLAALLAAVMVGCGARHCHAFCVNPGDKRPFSAVLGAML